MSKLYDESKVWPESRWIRFDRAWQEVKAGSIVTCKEPGFPEKTFTVTRKSGGSGEPGDPITVGSNDGYAYCWPWPLTVKG